MRLTELAFVMSVTFLGCNKSADAEHQESAQVPADNTGKNERDRNSDALTPGDQGGSEEDRGITQKIRQGVVADDDLSTTAKNIKIITVEGVVTLRGPVSTLGEKAAVERHVQSVQGVKRLDSQLEVAAK